MRIRKCACAMSVCRLIIGGVPAQAVMAALKGRMVETEGAGTSFNF